MTTDNTPTPATYAAGWYADASQPGFERWYDGTAWTTQTRPADQPAEPVPGSSAQPPKKRRKGWIIGGSIAAAVIVIGAIGAAAGAGSGSGSGDSDADPSSVTAGERTAEKVAVPDVVGMTVADAKAALTDAGFTVTTSNDDTDIVTSQSATELVKGGAVLLQGEPADVEVPNVVGKTASEAASALEAAGLAATYDGDGSAKVTAQGAKAGSTAKRGTAIALTLAPPMTLAQQSAVESAQQYVDNLGGFSKKRLIEQLKFEQFSSADAKFAAEHITVNWNEQAAQSAQSYMDMGGFSKGSLRDQLKFEGFTAAQISYALKAVGY